VTLAQDRAASCQLLRKPRTAYAEAATITDQPPPTTRHLLTVALEDYYQVGAFNRLIQKGQWYRFEARLEQSTRRTLDLLDHHGVRATFFVVGWVAERLPELVREVAARGHELASKGYYHRNLHQMSPGEFREDLARAREAIQQAGNTKVLGYRVADDWFRPEDLWALDLLAEEGYEYDSSVAPLFRRYSAEPWRRFAHPHLYGEKVLWEFPISTADVFGWGIPIAGGNWFRQLPHWAVRRAVRHWIQRYTVPFVMYFHVWELDPDQPKIEAASWLTRVRQYRHLDRMPSILSYYLERYRFTAISDYLGVGTALPDQAEGADDASLDLALPSPVVAPAEETRETVTVVVPCYNEELVLPYLANTLEQVALTVESNYRLNFLFVDDGSVDGTWNTLRRLFEGRDDCRLIQHPRNRGVAAAIFTGIREAQTELVCSIDCDCTYDPHELGPMIELLGDDVAMVTASPYHRDGTVRNVPPWRLFLSRTLSRLYRIVLRHKLATYTSCFRAYRRGPLLEQRIRRSGFLGVSEMLGRLDLAGHKIVEYPATLEVRVLGHSKMKVASTILGHLGLLIELWWKRVTSRQTHAPETISGPEAKQRRNVGSL